jgi:hypothetical protein
MISSEIATYTRQQIAVARRKSGKGQAAPKAGCDGTHH